MLSQKVMKSKLDAGQVLEELVPEVDHSTDWYQRVNRLFNSPDTQAARQHAASFEDPRCIQEVKAQPKSHLLPTSQKHPTTSMTLPRSSRRGPPTYHLSSRQGLQGPSVGL